jgi:hypothetical protein
MTEYYLETDEFDPDVWVGVPLEWPTPGFEKEFPDIPAWADVAANALWDASALTPHPGELDQLAGILGYAAKQYPTAYPGFEVLLHLPGPRDTPIPVYIGDIDVDDAPEAELRFWTGENDPNAVEPPVVEKFTSPHLGTGRRVLRYTVDPDDPDRSIIVALRYGWYIKELGRVGGMFTLSPDPGRLISAMDDLDALARGLQYVPAED